MYWAISTFFTFPTLKKMKLTSIIFHLTWFDGKWSNSRLIDFAKGMTISFTLFSFLISVMKKSVLTFFWLSLTVADSPGRVSLAGAVKQFWRYFWSVWISSRLEADDLVFSAGTYEAFGSGVIPGVNVPTYSRHSGWVRIEGVPCGPDAGSGATFSGFLF